MGIFRSLFGGRKNAEDEARELMREVEEFLEENGPLMTVQFMDSEEFKRLERQYWPKELIGPGGPLHSEFLSLLSKVKARGDRKFGAKAKPVPSPEHVMRKTGMSEDELTRRFMEHLIQQGKNPFKEMPEHMLRDAEEKFPDLVQLARRKFGTSR